MIKPVKLLSLLFGVLLISSCSDDDKEVKPANEYEIPTEFSELTTEQSKAKLEENGLLLVNNMNQLKGSAGIKTAVSFSHFLSLSDLPATESGRKVTSIQPLDLLQSLAQFGRGKNSASEVLSGFRMKETDPQTAQELFDSQVGVFAFNSTDETWTFTAADNGKIVFQFPSTEAGTANNAEFVIYGYTSVQIQNTEAEYTGDLPTALKADLTVNGTKQISYSFIASYKNNGEPTAVETSLAINPFTFKFELTNNSSEVSAEYSLTNGNQHLISFGFGGNGNFSSSNINGSGDAGSVLEKASAYFQIVNIRFAGEADVKSIDALLADDATAEEEAEAYNAHSTFVVFYADSKKKIADTEFYGVTESETYCWQTDINGDGILEEECYTYTDEIIDIRLIFADGSKADLDTYTDVGFEEVRTELEKFADELEADLE